MNLPFFSMTQKKPSIKVADWSPPIQQGSKRREHQSDGFCSFKAIFIPNLFLDYLFLKDSATWNLFVCLFVPKDQSAYRVTNQPKS
jgi:hypothetical protein